MDLTEQEAVVPKKQTSHMLRNFLIIGKFFLFQTIIMAFSIYS